MPDPMIPTILTGNLPTQGERQNTRGQLDYDDNVVILEDVRHGNLGAWLESLATANRGKPLGERERPPEKVLWSILYCLYRACLAMAYPGRLTGRGPGGVDAPIPAQPETRPSGARKKTSPTDALVHFNLRPSNGTFDCILHASRSSILFIFLAHYVLMILLLKVLFGEFDDGVGHEIFPILKVSRLNRRNLIWGVNFKVLTNL